MDSDNERQSESYFLLHRYCKPEYKYSTVMKILSPRRINLQTFCLSFKVFSAQKEGNLKSFESSSTSSVNKLINNINKYICKLKHPKNDCFKAYETSSSWRKQIVEGHGIGYYQYGRLTFSVSTGTLSCFNCIRDNE